MLSLNAREYLEMPGLNVMLGQDFYPEGHQGGVVIIQNGNRVASNGDIRLEPCPGQWQPVPRQLGRSLDYSTQSISARFAFPDQAKNRQGFNPIDYPDLEFSYAITIKPAAGGFTIRVDLDSALPPDWVGPVGFNLELFPGWLFGQAFSMHQNGKVERNLFPRDPIGPLEPDGRGGHSLRALARGERLEIAPGNAAHRLAITALGGGELELLDGRQSHNNGWFIVRSAIPAGATQAAVEWLVEPHAIPGFLRQPVIQCNQLGYHPDQEKRAFVELDINDRTDSELCLIRLEPNGVGQASIDQPIVMKSGQRWGEFLRYSYIFLDFTAITEEGWYALRYGDHHSPAFRIDRQVYTRGVWQSCLDYFLPVQMCHMRVVDGYRVWHGACHLSDAQMAPTSHIHFDGYAQGPDTLCKFEPGAAVPELNKGGWHDAGDFDLRIESQAATVHGLCLSREAFRPDYDSATIDQERRLVVLRQPDGTPDILQQIEHGLLSILGGLESLGRPYRGIIESNLADYVLLGDPVNHTEPRWVFIEENPAHAALTGCALAAAARVLLEYKPILASQCLNFALGLWRSGQETPRVHRLALAAELLLCHRDHPSQAREFLGYILANGPVIAEKFGQLGDSLARVFTLIRDGFGRGEPAWQDLQGQFGHWETQFLAAAQAYKANLDRQASENPYGVPFQPHIWGAGWQIQRLGVQQYFLSRHLPQFFDLRLMRRAFDFIMGCHPGANPASFVSGVGANSVTIAYGLNRADWSYIPGGSVSGTSLIRPDFPELMDWPYFWQQTEYVLGGGTADWLFLALAMDHLSGKPGSAESGSA